MKTKEIVLKVTDGLVGSATNAVLWWLFLFGASFGKSKTSYGAYLMFREADQALSEFNYDTFKQIISRLKQEGMIVKKKAYSTYEIEVTSVGKRKLEQALPFYQEKRPWDGFVYLISYDIPEAKRRFRDLLREHLRKIGCALLQESLWLTPYNPRKILDEFMSEHAVGGTILISKLGKDGAIGQERFEDFLERVYGLQKINDRYRDFIESYGKEKSILCLAVAYQGILREDPQLPRQLLPKNWLGDRAYKTFQQKVANSRSGR